MENKSLCEKLYKAAVKELAAFENSLDTVKKALDAAYELSVKRDILSYIENELNEITDLNMEMAIEKLAESGTPLSNIYDEWLGNEYDNRMEAIKMTADDIIEITADKVRSEQKQIAAELMQGNYCFTVLSLNGENEIAVDEYVGKNDPAIYELDEFRAYAAAQVKDVNEIEVEASFYTIGNGGEDADSPSEEQMKYINEHLETILDKADLLESNTFTVDISEMEREAETELSDNKKLYAFTVAEFEDGSRYVFPGLAKENDIVETSEWQEVKERNFVIDKNLDLDEDIRVTLSAYNITSEECVIPSSQELEDIRNNLDTYIANSELTEGIDTIIFPWENCDDIIYDMTKHWEEVHSKNHTVSDDFDKENFLFPKHLKVIARNEGKEYYNLDESIEQIKLSGKEWLEPYDAAVEMNLRGVDIKDIEMLSVRYVSATGDVGHKDMTPEMYAVYHTRTEEHTNEFKEAVQSFEAKSTEVYKKSFAEAKEAGEIDLYHRSNKVNQNCANMIDAVASSHYENNHFHAKDALDAVMERGYAIERVALVVAVNIADKDWDMRLSAQNISWANEYLSDFPAEMKDRNRKSTYYTTMHPGLLNMFVDAVREKTAFQKESYADRLDDVADIADKIADAIDNGEIGKEEQTKGQER